MNGFQDVWIDAFHDPFSELSTRSILFSDLFDDGRYRLIAIHSHKGTTSTPTKALRIFDGTELAKELVVKSTIGMVTDIGHGLLAVAGDRHVYFFKGQSKEMPCQYFSGLTGMKPYYRFELKSQQSDEALTGQESDVWVGLKNGPSAGVFPMGCWVIVGDIEIENGLLLLKELADVGQIRSSMSTRMLTMPMASTQRGMIEKGLMQFDVEMRAFVMPDGITCLTVMKTDMTDRGILVIGRLP